MSEIPFTGTKYRRDLRNPELTQAIRDDLTAARKAGLLPPRVRVMVTPLVTETHSETIMIVIDGADVHAAEYAKVLEIANAYNRIEETQEGYRYSHYRLEIFAPASPEVREHPVTALINQLGTYGHQWRDRLTEEESDAIAVVQHGLERATAEDALSGTADQPHPAIGHQAEAGPPCNMTCDPVGIVGWPPEIEAGQPHASTHVCDNPAHQVGAIQWVRDQTGHVGVFRTFEEIRAS